MTRRQPQNAGDLLVRQLFEKQGDHRLLHLVELRNCRVERLKVRLGGRRPLPRVPRPLHLRLIPYHRPAPSPRRSILAHMADRRIQRHPPKPGIGAARPPIPLQRPPDLKQLLLIKILSILPPPSINAAKPQHPLPVLPNQTQESRLQRLHSALVSRRCPNRITAHVRWPPLTL